MWNVETEGGDGDRNRADLINLFQTNHSVKEATSMDHGIHMTKKAFIGLAAGAFFLASTQVSFACGREAKNVILMISDGQGFNTVRATKYYTGKRAVYERFMHKYGMQTNSAVSAADTSVLHTIRPKWQAVSSMP